MNRSISERLKTIQSRLQLEPDGVLGPDTMTALEKALKLTSSVQTSALKKASKNDTGSTARHQGLTLDTQELQAIVNDEIGSPAYYRKRLKSPCWPGGDSGVTIGVGYDLGYVDSQRFSEDWSGQLAETVIERLAKYCTVKGAAAKQKLRYLSDIEITLAKASAVFRSTSVPSYAAKAQRAFPGIEQLAPIAQTALLSLVYNRGASMKGQRRKEMRAIRKLIKSKNYQAMADQVRLMKHLWEGRGLDGLLIRREREALALELAAKNKPSKKTIKV